MTSNAAGRKTVLIVEDDELVRAAIMEELDERGLNVLEAEDSMAALAIIESDVPLDLLIADIGLPGLDGRRLADMAQIMRPELKILFLTGYNSDAVLESLPARTKIVEKPIELHVLAMLAKAMIEER